MSYQEILKKFQAEAEFEVVLTEDADYEFARSISNSRFHYRPGAVSFCAFPEDVATCLAFCKKHDVSFRVRSGGHHHEGMSSGNGLMVLDLSRLYRDQETNQCEIWIEDDFEHAWIPPGMKLARVYEELRKIGMVIPGGGCQSVNVGGLTQGGGWGVHIRKYGLTCDQLVDAEVVLADGTVARASELTEEEHEKDGKELMWALRGGGGGNFGVVTRFKFRLCPLNKVMTTFGIFWKKKADIINMITRWAELHEQNSLPPELSCTTNMWRVNDGGEKPPFPEPVRGRMGGNFYGTKAELIKILRDEFGSLIPMDGDKPLISSDGNGLDAYFSSIDEREIKILAEVSADDENTTADPLDQDVRIHTEASLEYTHWQLNLITGMTDQVSAPTHEPAKKAGKANALEFKYDVLPAPPNTTCDMPHPHKVTSLYPKDGIDHRRLANQIYDQLSRPPFLADVNRYMVWHCLGGAMRNEKFEKDSSFAFRHKPYMLQLQSWWNHAGQLRNDKSRDVNYTQWVNDFRKELAATGWTEGAFINFVDRDIVEDISTEKGRLELLKYYYGENLDRLRAAKTAFDKDNLFDFAMGLLPLNPDNSLDNLLRV